MWLGKFVATKMKFFLGGICLCHIGFATLAFEHKDQTTTFIWENTDQVNFRSCKVSPFREEDLKGFSEKILPECDRDLNKKLFSISKVKYLRSLSALYKIPSSLFFGEDPLQKFETSLVNAEIASRSNSGRSAQEWETQFELLLNEVVQYFLLEKNRYLSLSSGEYYSLYFSAITAFSNIFWGAHGALMLGKAVSSSEIWDSCFHSGWAPISSENLSEILSSQGEDLRRWTQSTQAPSAILTWSEVFEKRKVRDGSYAFQKVQTFKVENLLGSSTYYGDSRFLNPTLCIKRELPRFRTNNNFVDSGGISLEAIAAQYETSKQGLIARVFQVEALEKTFAQFFDTHRGQMPNSLYQVAKIDLDKMFGIGLPNWEEQEKAAQLKEQRELEQKLAQVKREREQKLADERRESENSARLAAQRAEDLRLKQLRDAELAAAKAESDRQDRIRQAKVEAQRLEEERRRNSTPLYAKRTFPGNRVYWDSQGREIDSNTYARQMNAYNEATYGRRLYDSNRTPVSKAQFDELNSEPAPSNNQTTPSYILFRPVYVVPQYYRVR